MTALSFTNLARPKLPSLIAIVVAFVSQQLARGSMRRPRKTIFPLPRRPYRGCQLVVLRLPHRGCQPAVLGLPPALCSAPSPTGGVIDVIAHPEPALRPPELCLVDLFQVPGAMARTSGDAEVEPRQGLVHIVGRHLLAALPGAGTAFARCLNKCCFNTYTVLRGPLRTRLNRNSWCGWRSRHFVCSGRAFGRKFFRRTNTPGRRDQTILGHSTAAAKFYRSLCPIHLASHRGGVPRAFGSARGLPCYPYRNAQERSSSSQDTDWGRP